MNWLKAIRVFAVLVILTSCSHQDDSPSPTGSSKQTQTASKANEPEKIVRFDFSERDDAQLEADLAMVRRVTGVAAVDLTWSKVDGDLLKQLSGLDNLRELNLFGTNASDRQLSFLDDLPNLEFIDLAGGSVSVPGILQLRASRKLKRIGLADVRPRLDDEAIEQIVAAWPNLESISLDNSQITDAGLASIGQLGRLRYLNISRTGINGEGLESLVNLSQLTTLHANNTQISDCGMQAIGKITSLRKLDLNETKITDQGLEHIGTLNKLNCIYFVGTAVTDKGLEFLKPLKSIEYVGPSAHVSQKSLDELKQELPRFKTNQRG